MHKIAEQNRPPGYYTVAEVAQLTGLKVRQIHDRIRSSKIHPVRKGYYLFIAPAELERFQKSLALESLPLDVFDYKRGCGPAPEVC